MTTESDVARTCDEYMARKGAYAVKLSQDIPTRRQLSGLPDRFYLLSGILWMVEFKRPGGRRRISQAQFAEAVKPYLWSTIRYVVIDDVAVLADALGDGCI